MFAPDGALNRVVRWPDRDRTVEGPFLSAWADMVQADPDMAPLAETVPLHGGAH